MTACTNHGGKARRVVTAALVGVLSVGTVPMVALATGADTTDGIETLVADWSTDAKVTAAEDGKGAAFTGDLTKPVSFDQGSGKYLVPTEVTGQAGTTEIDPNEYDLTYTGGVADAISDTDPKSYVGLVIGWTYKAEGVADFVYGGTLTADQAAAYFSGTLTGSKGEKITVKADDYTVTIAAKDGSGTPVNTNFEIADANPYAGTYAYEGTDTDDTSFVYDGNSKVIRLAKADGTPINNASGVTVTFYQSNGQVYTDTDSDNFAATISGTGSYSAVVKDGSETVATVNFSVEKYDVSKHGKGYDDTLTLGSGQAAKDDILKSVVGTWNDAAGDPFWWKFQVTDVTAPSGAKAFDGSYGEYTVTVAAKTGAGSDANVTGQKTIKFSYLNDSVYTDEAAYTDDYVLGLYYGGQVATSGVNIDLTSGQAFDASRISVREDDGTPSLSGDALEVTYYDTLNTKSVDATALAKPGVYEVTVRVKPFQDENGRWVGGTDSFTVTVNGNKAYSDNVTFYVDGELAGASGTLEYDGTDLLPRVTANVANPEGGSFVAGTDYELVATKDGEEVDSIVDAGTYTVTVKPLTITLADTSGYDFTLTVTPQTVDQLTSYSYNGETWYFPTNKNDLGGDNYGNRGLAYHNDAVAWTGSAVEVPGVQYVDGDEVKTLDQSLYNVVSIKKGDKVVKEVVDEGTYTVRIALSDEAKSNYALEEREFTFEVVKYNPFDDVKSPAWYASAVADAKFNNVVNGMSGTNMYAPEAKISRADAVGILFNLAGGSAVLDDNMYTEEGGWLTGFDDVDGNAYYAGALAWAHKAGVVNGHGGNFRPTDSITREELATMLANYAKATGDFVASDGSALAAIADGSDVSAWAQESVAWAVENEIMGNGGFVAAHTDITRAEVAAMAVNYADKF